MLKTRHRIVVKYFSTSHKKDCSSLDLTLRMCYSAKSVSRSMREIPLQVAQFTRQVELVVTRELQKPVKMLCLPCTCGFILLMISHISPGSLSTQNNKCSFTVGGKSRIADPRKLNFACETYSK